MTGAEEKQISLFYSYSHKDEELRRRLEEHLAVLRRNGTIAEWHDRKIDPGEEWAKEIDDNLAGADIILLLVSASFIASDYCWGQEMTKAIDRHERAVAKVIPIILKPCRWQKTPFAKLQALPMDGRPVTAWPDQEEALEKIAAGIEGVVEALRTERAKPPPISAYPVIRDICAPWCPELVALPAGSFLMGSPESEGEREEREGPRHPVTLGYEVGIGRYPVTFTEYERFCYMTRRRKPSDQSWGRGRRPVIDVSWDDAQAYCAWLTKVTKKSYRLPSEAEWEYACRAGTTTRYAFGDRILSTQANIERRVGETSEVGTYPANAWGLCDMHGNVWEWVEDIWHDIYRGAPTDGRAWLVGGYQERRVLRGGSWSSGKGRVRSAYRTRNDPDVQSSHLGFRVARTLVP